MLWYYAKNDQRFGPVEEAELRRLAAEGQLSPVDLVWRQDFPDWRRAGEVEGIFPASARVVMPPPPPPAAFVPPPTSPGSIYSPFAPEQPVQTNQYADFGSRFAAILIDGVIVFVCVLFFGFMLGIGLALTGGSAQSIRNDSGQLMIRVFVGLFYWLYFALCESSTKMATPGKRALGLVVTDLQGHRISFGRASGRFFGRIVSGIFLIGYFAMLWSSTNQTWHDQMADCLVLKRR
jgi:uncharacterized RDD family membrane protein YckC